MSSRKGGRVPFEDHASKVIQSNESRSSWNLVVSVKTDISGAA